MTLMRDNKVCIMGMGYVGLTLAVVMAEKGFHVSGVEINSNTLTKLQNKTPHFFEQGLEIRLKRVVEKGALTFYQKINEIPLTVQPSIFVITVGTPLGENNKSQMHMVKSVGSEIASHMPEDSLVILRSTVRLGTTRNVVLPILKDAGKKFSLAYCPERTLEGKAFEELTKLPQIVGGHTQEDMQRASDIFHRITPTVIRVSSLESAEIIKLLDNSYRDHMFAFGNEVALLCEATGLDGIEVIRAANLGYERTNIAMPGFVGGPCLHKDPHILIDSLTEFDYSPTLIKHGRALNESISSHVIAMALRDLPNLAETINLKISILGLAFKGKPETDDIRATPAIELIAALKKRFPSAEISGQDFAVSNDAIHTLGIEACTLEEAFTDASLVIVANNNAKYQWIELDGLVSKMRKPGLVFDVWSIMPIDESQTSIHSVKVRRFGSSASWSKRHG
jgi:UDP-N-acetyl-D-mannosaminuronic acid dehydrogenase